METINISIKAGSWVFTYAKKSPVQHKRILWIYRNIDCNFLFYNFR